MIISSITLWTLLENNNNSKAIQPILIAAVLNLEDSNTLQPKGLPHLSKKGQIVHSDPVMVARGFLDFIIITVQALVSSALDQTPDISLTLKRLVEEKACSRCNRHRSVVSPPNDLYQCQIRDHLSLNKTITWHEQQALCAQNLVVQLVMWICVMHHMDLWLVVDRNSVRP